MNILPSDRMPVMCVKKTFVRKGDMNRHQFIHSGQRLYACDVCNKTFKQKNNLKTHQLVHSGQRPYACEVCKKKLLGRVLCIDTRLYTVVSVHMTVMCVIKHSDRRVML